MAQKKGIAATPQPPYYAVIFTSRRTDKEAGYPEMAERMVELASRQPGFLGVESVREGQVGITVSYWTDISSIRAWKSQIEHQTAQRRGKQEWYESYAVRVSRVERAYGFGRS